ncbi:ABC transporter permease [candidate division KSB1 bacterium]
MKNKSRNIPKVFSFLLNFVTSDSDISYLRGDYEEIYLSIFEKEGRVKAVLWILRQIFKSVIVYLSESIIWSVIMFKNYLKSTFRHLSKNRSYTIINIIGLSIGFVCCILIGLYVYQELSWDRFHRKADRIYRITMEDEVSTPVALHKFLRTQFSEVQDATSFAKLRMPALKFGDIVFYEPYILITDNSVFNIFSFKLISGDRNNVLKEPNTVVLSEKIAKKYFGTENPVNKTIQIDKRDFVITAVMEDIPYNSHFHTNFFISINSFDWYETSGWGNNFSTTYLLLHENVNYKELEDNIFDLETNFIFNGNPDHQKHYYLQPMTDIHLHSNLKFELEPNNDIANIYIFSTSAVLILLIACFNFMNISTAKSSFRAREIGIRKTVGSNRMQLILQFFSESVLLSFIALLFGFIIILILLPMYGSLIGREIHSHDFFRFDFIVGFFGLAFLTGLLSGSYPAFFLSSFKPVNILKGKLPKGKKSTIFRNMLVVSQFTVSIFLIIGVLTVFKQLDFLKNTDLGFDKEQVLVVKNKQKDDSKSKTFKQNITKYPGIVSVSITGNIPGKGFARNFCGKTDGERFLPGIYFCDHDFLKTMKLEMKEGRFFTDNEPVESYNAILNETAVKNLNFEDPIGKSFYRWDNRLVHIIGVIKDFHYESLHNNVNSLVLLYGFRKGWGVDYITVRLNTKNISDTIELIKNEWVSVNPELPFDYSFMDEEYNALYENEQRTGSVAMIFTFLAVFVSCLGLFGLSSFIVQQRTSEIGIRKVFGASVNGIVFLLSKGLLRWLIVSFVLAFPTAGYVLNIWLQNFAYKTTMEITLYISAGLLAVLVGFLTVSFQTFRAARTNPADILKYE